MAEMNLTTEEMLGVSAAWIDPKRLRHSLEAIPLLAAMLPEIERAHSALARSMAVPRDVAKQRALSLLHERGVEADALHDRKARGVFKILDGLVDLADDPDEGVGYEVLRRLLFPTDDLSVAKASWKVEATHGGRLRALLAQRPEHVAALRAIPLPRGSLYYETQQWLEAAAELACIEDERARVESATAPEDIPPGDTAAARDRWIAVAKALVSNTMVAGGVDDAARRTILGGYRDVEARADVRALQRRSRRPPPLDGPSNT